jgi:hypothetical protein
METAPRHPTKPTWPRARPSFTEMGASLFTHSSGSCSGLWQVALHVRTVPPSHAESIESAQVLSSMVPRGHCPRAILHLRREHMSRLPSAPPPTSPPPSSPLPRVSLPCDCPILRPRAGLLLSRACDSPFAMSFGSTHAHASPLILAARCWLLHVCAETCQAPFKLAAACVPISPCCRISHAA